MNSLLRRIAPGAATFVTILLAPGCDLPTEMPVWETRWIVPGETTRFGAGSFLPERIRVSDDSTVFLLEVAEFMDGRTLAQLCPVCTPLDGQTVPKPPFSGILNGFGSFPGELEAASMEEGGVTLALSHGFSFDPIRPGLNAGALRIRVWNGSRNGRLLSDTLVSGEAEAFPPGTLKLIGLPLEPGVIQDGLFVEVGIDSPLGDPTKIWIDESFEGGFRPDPLRLASVRLLTAGRTVGANPSTLDVEDLDAQLVARVMDGAIEVSVGNPLDLSLDVDLIIRAPEIPDLVRHLAIPPGETMTRLDFTGEELRSFLGRAGVTLEGSGTVREDAPPVDLSPLQEVSLRLTLDLTLQMGAQP